MSSEIEANQKYPNPWFNIWFHPRSTIRHILDTDPKYGVYLLAILSGIFRFLDQAGKRTLGKEFSLPWILVLSLVSGVVGGLLTLYIGGWWFGWVGSWFKGKASSEEVRTALAWSSIPSAISLIVMVIPIAIFGESYFSGADTLPNSGLTVLLIALLGFIGLVFLVWRFWLLVKCLAEAHQFSSWKSLLTLIVGSLVVVIPLLGLGFLTRIF